MFFFYKIKYCYHLVVTENKVTSSVKVFIYFSVLATEVNR